jgi:methylenetetrahydrofolate reductase (NADPH)
MGLKDHYQPGKTGLSFELFPPKSASGITALQEVVTELNRYNPDYFTCTYGAGGSTRDATLDIITSIKQLWRRPVASHLTCVQATVDQLRRYLSEAKERGVDYIVALRGDPPKGECEFKAIDGGLRYANELTSLIRREFPQFGIAVAGYPEVHQEALDAKTDLENLKRKVDAGADIIITQLFYNNEDYFRFCESCQRLRIHIPIVPGILPVTNLAQIQRITKLCKAALPAKFSSRLAEKEDAHWQSQVGVEFATEQVSDLLAQGVPGVHFYVLNKSDATGRILHSIPQFASRFDNPHEGS